MKTKKPETNLDGAEILATFSIIQLEIDQGPPIPTQRILQVIRRGQQTKHYVTESAYFRGELMELLGHLMTVSYEKSIMKRQSSLKPIKSERYWVHFTKDTVAGNKQPRVNPEAFE